jgi:hypothetical protein
MGFNGLFHVIKVYRNVGGSLMGFNELFHVLKGYCMSGECHLIDKESTEESVSLLATYLERTYSLDLIGAIEMIRHYPYTAL